MIARIYEWLKGWLWADDLRRVPAWRALGIGAARVLVHAIQSFSRNLVGVQAAGLAMLTLLALVPTLWLGLGVAELLGFADTLNSKLDAIKHGDFARFEDVITNFQLAVNRVSFKGLGLIGCLVLVYSGYSLLVTVERAFNHVWKARHRSWYTRIGSFLAVVVIVPVFMFSAIVVESVLKQGSFVEYMRADLPWLAYLYDAGVRFVPAVILWIAFVLLYKLMPSAKVRWRAAAIAAGVATLALMILHGYYLKAQVGMAVNNKIYAALAALPMLMVFLSLVWTIVLAGVQVGFAVQNLDDLGPPEEVPEAEHGAHRRLALALAHAAAQQPALDLTEFTQSLDVPREWIDEAVGDLVAADLLAVDEEDRATLIRDPERLTMWDVVAAVETTDANRELELPPEFEDRLDASMAAAKERLEGVALRQPPPRETG